MFAQQKQAQAAGGAVRCVPVYSSLSSHQAAGACTSSTRSVLPVVRVGSGPTGTLTAPILLTALHAGWPCRPGVNQR